MIEMERIGDLCERLGLGTMATQLPHVADKSARNELSFSSSSSDSCKPNFANAKSAAERCSRGRPASGDQDARAIRFRVRNRRSKADAHRAYDVDLHRTR